MCVCILIASPHFLPMNTFIHRVLVLLVAKCEQRSVLLPINISTCSYSPSFCRIQLPAFKKGKLSSPLKRKENFLSLCGPTVVFRPLPFLTEEISEGHPINSNSSTNMLCISTNRKSPKCSTTSPRRLMVLDINSNSNCCQMPLPIHNQEYISPMRGRTSSRRMAFTTLEMSTRPVPSWILRSNTDRWKRATGTLLATTHITRRSTPRPTQRHATRPRRCLWQPLTLLYHRKHHRHHLQCSNLLRCGQSSTMTSCLTGVSPI